jgi:hypothetical protein
MKWWGWGDPERRIELSPAATSAVREELGVATDDGREPVAIDDVALPEARPIPDAVLAAGGEVLDGDHNRIRYAAGRAIPTSSDFAPATSRTLPTRFCGRPTPPV